jgi:hypothetical protein
MPELSELIREYAELLQQERWIEDRKAELRKAIADEMAQKNLKSANSAHGTVQRTSRFKLLPRREDLFAFAGFTPARVKEVLVPKYGREALLPLFDIQKSEMLVIKRPPGIF